MTRCKEFYEKLEKDGNFCGMRSKDFSQAMSFWKDVEKDKDGKPSKTCDAWVRDERKQAASHKYVEQEKPKEKTVVKQYEFAKEVNNFIQWCFTQRKEEVIREVIEKAIVNSR